MSSFTRYWSLNDSWQCDIYEAHTRPNNISSLLDIPGHEYTQEEETGGYIVT